MSDRIRVKCPYCTQVVTMPGGAEGAKAACPVCGRKFKVPQRAPPARPPTADSSPAAPPSAEPTAAPPSAESPLAASASPAQPTPEAPSIAPPAGPPHAPADPAPTPAVAPESVTVQTITCGRCGLQMQVDSGSRGQTLGCPACGWQFTVGQQPAGQDQPSAAGGAPPGRLTVAPASISQPAERAPAERDEPVAPRMVAHLRQALPWVLLLGTLGFICCGLMILAGMALVMAGASARSPGGLAFGAIWLLTSLTFIVPACLLFRYAASIRRLVISKKRRDLEAALAIQASFWKFVGVLALVVLCIYAIVVLVALLTRWSVPVGRLSQ